MSGGEFDYLSCKINYIANEIEEIVARNNDPIIGRNYSDKTIKNLKNGIKALRIAAVYEKRIDWLLSDDDNEEWFLKRLSEELKNI